MDSINKLYKDWLALQPIKPEYEREINRKFSLEFNYNSNHIEGNTLTYGETELLLIFGETSGSHSFRDLEEMKAHNVALELVKQEAENKERPLTENFIRELNKIILVEPFTKQSETPSGDKNTITIKIGEYKSRPNHVRTATGQIFSYAMPEETSSMMADLVSWYNSEESKKELSPLELAALLHYRYIRIHPFEDGNGRIARLLVNYVLHRNNYPMLIIKTKDKDNYLRILHQCDINVGLTPSDGALAKLEEITPFVEYMSEQLERSLKLSIKAAKGESITEVDDIDKEIALLQRQIKKNRNKSGERIGSITQLIKELDDKLGKFDVLFERVGYNIYLYGTYGRLNFENPKFLLDSLDFKNEWGRLNMCKYFSSLKDTHVPSNASLSLDIDFFTNGDYKIAIYKEKESMIERQFNKNISQSDISDFVEQASYIVLEQIQNSLKED